MSNLRKKGFLFVLLSVLTLAFGITAQAKEEDTIKTGVYAGEIDLSGKTQAEATAAIEAYMEDLQAVEITLQAADDKTI